jgi:predicted neutral ceramidase superfamily lipid hydrolase
MGEHGAAHPDDDPEDLHRGRRRLKESHTSHWDLDYMSREEMEKLAEASRQARDKEHRD